MLECERILRQLYQFLDRELSESEIAQVKQHLDRCPPCHDHVRLEASVRRLVRTTCAGDLAPAHLRGFIREKLRGASF